MAVTVDLAHRFGLNCVSAGLRDLLEFGTGSALDEDYCYGLASGLFFGYIKMPDFTAMGAATDNLLENVAATLSARLIIEESDGDDWPHLKELLDNGMPVMVETSNALVARYSGNWGRALRGKTAAEAQEEAEEIIGAQMGRHYVVVTGYDPQREVVFCVDNRTALEIPRHEFMRARTPSAERSFFFSDRNRIVYFLFPGRIPDLAYRTILSIRRTVDFWLNHPEHPRYLADRVTAKRIGVQHVYNTLDGMKMFAEDFPALGVQHGPAYAGKSIAFINTIVPRSSGADMARGVYARFLTQAAGVTGLERLNQSARDYQGLARDWREFFRWLSQNQVRILAAPDSPEIVRELQSHTRSLADREAAAIHRLAETAVTWS